MEEQGNIRMYRSFLICKFREVEIKQEYIEYKVASNVFFFNYYSHFLNLRMLNAPSAHPTSFDIDFS